MKKIKIAFCILLFIFIVVGLLLIKLIQDPKDEMLDDSIHVFADSDQVGDDLCDKPQIRRIKPKGAEDMELEHQVVEIAQKAIKELGIDHDSSEAKVELIDGTYRVVFPFITDALPGTYLGPDYAAEVYIDSETMQVIKILGG